MARAATTEQVMAWRRAIAEQARGDETQSEFCDRRGLKLESFRAWKYRLAREGGAGGGAHPAAMSFVPVKLVERAVDVASGVEVALPGGRVVRVARGFDEETLKRLVETLEARPC